MQLSMSDQEAELLEEILSNYVSDLRMEISNTDNYDLRTALKQREASIKAMLGRFERTAS